MANEPQEKIDFSKIDYVDYKNVDLLKRFLNEQGMLMPRRVSGVSAEFQRQLTLSLIHI